MCAPHWRRVPKVLQSAIWKHYRPGQENDKNPTLCYLVVQQLAVAAVASKEGHEEGKAHCIENAGKWADLGTDEAKALFTELQAAVEPKKR